MAAAISGDLVLDVVRAADPQTAQAARARLASFSAGTAQTPFSASVAAPSVAAADTAPTDTAHTKTAGARPAKAAIPETYVRFEAMVLQTFLQTMLPKDTESVYGEGLAGEMWQSMLAEQIGVTMARRGGIGIAERVLGDHYLVDEAKVPVQGVAPGPDRAALDEQRLLSTALVHEIQRRAADTLDERQSTSRSESL